jgi:hypothetical protein
MSPRPAPAPASVPASVPSNGKVMARPRDKTPPPTWQQVEHANHLSQGTAKPPPAPSKY